jgi:hypothetical protein
VTIGHEDKKLGNFAAVTSNLMKLAKVTHDNHRHVSGENEKEKTNRVKRTRRVRIACCQPLGTRF